MQSIKEDIVAEYTQLVDSEFDAQVLEDQVSAALNAQSLEIKESVVEGVQGCTKNVVTVV